LDNLFEFCEVKQHLAFQEIWSSFNRQQLHFSLLYRPGVSAAAPTNSRSFAFDQDAVLASGLAAAAVLLTNVGAGSKPKKTKFQLIAENSTLSDWIAKLHSACQNGSVIALNLNLQSCTPNPINQLIQRRARLAHTSTISRHHHWVNNCGAASDVPGTSHYITKNLRTATGI
jgi:hypothetical protein